MSIKLLSNLDFAAKLNSIEAVTESGAELLKKYRGYMYQNPASCGIVNGFIKESQNYGYDTSIMTILESVLKYVTENKISWKLATACESVANNNSSYGYIAKLGINQVEKLLEMDENQVIQYIKGGCLKNVQYIPEFRNVCKEVYQSNITEVKTNTYQLNTPYSYVHIDESGQYFNVLGKTYKNSNNKVSGATLEDITFSRINNLLNNFTYIDEALVYEYKQSLTADSYKFSINENGIKFNKGEKISEVFESIDKFKQYADTYAKQLFGKDKFTFLNTCGAVADVYENFENIAMIDCANVMQCSDGTILSIIESKDNVNINVARSVHYGSSNQEFEYMTEAVKYIKSITNTDLANIYKNRIDEELRNADPEGYKAIQEQLEAAKDEKMAYRKNKISMLAEKFKNDPIKIALLNNVAKELSILESNNE